MAQIVRPQEPEQHQEQQHWEEHDHGEGLEKKSMLKKVKAKAKKIKDTLKLHGHAHDEGGHRAPDDHDLDEEDDDDGDDEMVDANPGLHGAPASLSSGMTEQREGTDNKVGDRVREREAATGQLGLGRAVPTGLEEDPHATRSRIGGSDPSNYQAKETDHTGSGGAEAGSSPIVPSFGKMTITDEEEHEPKEKNLMESSFTFPTGTRDQFSPDQTHDKQTNDQKDVPMSEMKTSGVSGSATGSYTEKISSATAAITDKAISAKNVITSKLGMGEKAESGDPMLQEEGQGGVPKTDTENTGASGSALPGSYAGKISSATSAITDKAISAKNVISSKLGMGENPEQGDPKAQEGQGGVPKTDSENLGVSGPASPGSYTGKIYSATAAISDKANSAKNVITSKLGIGEKPEREPGNPEAQDAAQAGTGSYSPVEYGKKMAATVTDKLSPVYEKVAGAGTAVISKVQSPRGGDPSEKGSSFKEYFTEKLKPGEEDKALSEVISKTLSKKKAEGAEEQSKPMGKVTESEAVKRQLGTSMEEDQGTRVDTSASSAHLSGGNVVDKLKGAFGSWFTKGEESSTGSDQVLSSSASATGEDEAGQRRLQESGN